MGATATAGTLTVGVGADVSGLKAQLAEGAQSVRSFADTSQRSAVSVQELAAAIKTLTGSSATVGSAGQLIVGNARDFELATGMVRKFGASIEVVRADLQATVPVATQAGGAVVAAADASEKSLRRMALAEIQAYEADAKRTAGLERSAAAARAAAEANAFLGSRATGAATATQGLATNALGFNAVTSRLAPATLAVAFGLSQMATAGDKSEGSLRTVLRAASVAALALGPEGILVGAALAAGDAIFTAFDKTRKEIEETTRKGAAEILRFRQSLNVGGLAQIAQLQFSGGQVVTDAGDVVFQEGIQQLQRRIARQRKIVEEGTSGTGQVSEAAAKALGEIEKLTPALQRLQAQHTATMAALKETLATVVDQTTTGFNLSAARDALRSTREETERLARAAEELRRAGITNVTRATPNVVPRTSAAPTDVTVRSLAATRSGFLDATSAASRFGGEIEAAVADTLRLVDAVGYLPVAFRDALSAIGGIGAGLRQGANALAALKTADSVGGSVSALASFAGAAGQIIGPLVALGQTIFGQSEIERENTRAINANTQSLRDARLAATGYDPRSASAIRATQGALGSADFGQLFLGVLRNTGTGDRQLFQEFLAPFKISIEQAESQAKAFGITLYNSQGQIIPEALAQFRVAMGLAAADLTRFGASLADQRTKLELADAVHDRTGSAAEFARELALLTAAKAGGLADAFKGLDVETAAGLRAAKQNLAALFDRFASGGLTAADLGDLTKEDFLAFIRGADSALDGLATAAQTAAGQLLNVPQGFRLALRTFEAQVATTLSGATGGSAAPFPTGGGFPSSAAPAPSGTTTVTIHFGDINTQATNAPQLARELGDVFVQKGSALGAAGAPLVNLGRALRA